jgi:hypothetical protein
MHRPSARTIDRGLDARWIEGQVDPVVPLELEEDRDDLEVVEEDQVVEGDARFQAEAELDVRRAALAARERERDEHPMEHPTRRPEVTMGHIQLTA